MSLRQFIPRHPEHERRLLLACSPSAPAPPFRDLPTPCSPLPHLLQHPGIPAPPARAAPAGSGTCCARREEGKLRTRAWLTGCRGCTTGRRRRNYFTHRNPILRVLRSCRFCCLQSGSEGSNTAAAGTVGPAGSGKTPEPCTLVSHSPASPCPLVPSLTH